MGIEYTTSLHFKDDIGDFKEIWRLGQTSTVLCFEGVLSKFKISTARGFNNCNLSVLCR